MKWILLLLLLTSCGVPEEFSPTYHDFVCVPVQALMEEPAVATPPSSECCGDKGGVVACCYGGSFMCVDGSGGVGCGCPSN